MSLTEAVVLGVIQGVFEWLPVSSEAVISILMTQLFGSGVTESLNSAIWLHTGTMLAALIYFREDFWELIEFSFDRLIERDFELRGSELENVFVFIVAATFVTSIFGGSLYLGALGFFGARPDLFAAITGLALLATGLLRFYQTGKGRVSKDVGLIDSTFVGILQGLAVIPGISRSGSTVFGLLYQDFSAEDAFRLSFLLSVPAVFIANIGINIFSSFKVSLELLIASAVAFVVGYFTIDIILEIADRAEVAYICFGLAGLSFLPLII